MNTSPVYFTDFRCHPGLNQQQKLRKLLLKAGMDKIDFQDKFVAIKMHFGELGNLAFLRPNYAKTVADLVKELGGHPFLTDCNTLYVGRYRLYQRLLPVLHGLPRHHCRWPEGHG